MPSKHARAIRFFCLECQGGSFLAVRLCQDDACPLRRNRLGGAGQKEDGPGQEAGGALRCIRRFCLMCAGERKAVRACAAKEDCVLWPFRFGVLPTTFKRVVRRLKRQRETLLLPGLGSTPGKPEP